MITAPAVPTRVDPPGPKEAWQMVASQLRMEMRRADYETWVEPLRPMGWSEGIYRLGAHNAYARDWVESRLRSRISGLLEGLLNHPVTLRFALIGESERVIDHPAEAALAGRAQQSPAPAETEVKKNGAKITAAAPVLEASLPPEPEKAGVGEKGSPRKIQLQRAYGTERARVVQPERGMFVTSYLFSNWLPLLGHSAFAAVLAARSLCYWNPMTGELRNVIETDIAELARRADVSVRTMKEVLNQPNVRRYFLRYRVRRVMTANGVRTAGIVLQVRMDDPLTPEDQEHNHLPEEERWYTADFEDERED